VVEAMKSAQLAKLGRQLKHFGHDLQARPVKLGFSRVWFATDGEDVPPHEAGIGKTGSETYEIPVESAHAAAPHFLFNAAF
jgi:hypothetical protein